MEVVVDHTLDHGQHLVLVLQFLGNTVVVDVPLTLSLTVLALEGVT